MVGARASIILTQTVAFIVTPVIALAKGAMTFIGIALAVVAVAAVVVAVAMAPTLAAAFTTYNVTSVVGVVNIVGTAATLTNAVGQGMCVAGMNSPSYTGCGGGGGGSVGGSGSGGGSGSAASGLGSTGTCSSGYYVCGNKTCIPIGSVCCASVGLPDKYCPSGYVCQSDGTCKSGGTPAAAPTSSFSASSGGQSASTGGSLTVGVGGPVNLSWSSTGATACVLDQGIGGVNSSGTTSITCNTPGAKPITLTCAGEGGEVKKTITLNCASIPKIKEIKPE